ncbi:MAG: chitin disaccharide deacetylase [Myxococcota bacterium]
MLKRFLIVNGDDFGESQSVNQGIISAYGKGILRSASVLAGGEYFSEAVELRAKNPGLDVGLHLALTDIEPTAPKERVACLLNKQGRFFSGYIELFTKIVLGRVKLDMVRREWNAQAERFLNAGFAPTHLDSHRHIHLFPPLLNIFIEIAVAYKFKCVRIPLEARGLSPLYPSDSLRISLILPFAVAGKRKIATAGLKSADNFAGLARSGTQTEESLENIIKNLKPGVTELMVHPGAQDEPEIKYFRKTELNALASPRLKEILEKEGIQPASFAQYGDNLP